MRLFLLYLFVNPLLSLGITDSFTDGDFSVNPTWIGDILEYKVNDTNQLQLNNTIAGTSYLSTANLLVSLDDMEWQFYIKQGFSPSASNYGRVYLASDQQNLEGALNGYYLQFGEVGSNDAVELFRQTGFTITSVARANPGEIASAFAVRIKVTRKTAGLWSIYVDNNGGTDFVLEATGTDNTYNTSSFFGVFCNYTASNASKIYFDDFYVGPIIVDSDPPVVSSINVLSDTQLDVIFNEPVELASAQTLVNYLVNNGIGNPSSSIRDGLDPSKVHLTFMSAFADDVQHVLTVNSVKDIAGNITFNVNTSFTYHAPVTAVYKDVIINEIFADPSPQIGLPLVEYIEVYNKSSKTFNLTGWKFADASSVASLNNYTLTPGDYLILCNVEDTSLFLSKGKTLGVHGFPSLNNSGDHLYLKDNNNIVIDSVNYSDGWYGDIDKKSGGWSLELINPSINNNCSISQNWSASNNVLGGTPGQQNSIYSLFGDTLAPAYVINIVDSLHINVCFGETIDSSKISEKKNYFINGINDCSSVTADSFFTCALLTLSEPLKSSTSYTFSINNIADCSGNIIASPLFFTYYVPKPFDVVINEIMADPDPSIGLPNYEFVELYNTTPYAIELEGWTLTIGEISKIVPPVTILPDSFLILTSASGAAEYANSISVLGIASFPSLINSGQTLILKNPTGLIISCISYTDEWYGDANKDEGGWSLEQIDANNPCAGMNNWKASTNILGGTPGRKNSIVANNPDTQGPYLLRASVIDSITVRLYFSESLDSIRASNNFIYFIDNEVGIPYLAMPIGPHYTSVTLKLNSQLMKGIYYNLTVNNLVTDCKGNELVSKPLVFAVPESAVPFDVILNELLFDPKPQGVDFVELYNRSKKVIDLKTLYLSSFDTISQTLISIHPISMEGYLLFPGEYVVLTTDTSAVKNQYQTINPSGFIQMQNMPAMNISDGIVVLSSDKMIVDKVAYYEGMHFPLLNDTKGVSLERIDYNRSSEDKTNWHSAAEDVGFATPAYQNSQYMFTAHENKLSVSPEIFSPDNDGHNDVVNVAYHLDSPGFVANVEIYDAKGRIVKSLLRNELLGLEGVFTWDGINNNREKAPIGMYVIYVELFNLQGEVKHFKNTCVLASKL